MTTLRALSGREREEREPEEERAEGGREEAAEEEAGEFEGAAGEAEAAPPTIEYPPDRPASADCGRGMLLPVERRDERALRLLEVGRPPDDDGPSVGEGEGEGAAEEEAELGVLLALRLPASLLPEPSLLK